MANWWTAKPWLYVYFLSVKSSQPFVERTLCKIYHKTEHVHVCLLLSKVVLVQRKYDMQPFESAFVIIAERKSI